jgi:hypothetical protein
MPGATITSGAIRTNSAAKARKRSGSPPLERTSLRTLSPSIHPNVKSPARNAATPLSYDAMPAPKTTSSKTA